MFVMESFLEQGAEQWTLLIQWDTIKKAYILELSWNLEYLHLQQQKYQLAPAPLSVALRETYHHSYCTSHWQ